jgi:uncharacterized membrane protein YhaH (DUF805 family)
LPEPGSPGYATGTMTALCAFGRASLRCLRLYAVFRGRADRSEFWFFLLFFLVGYVFVVALDMGLGSPVVRLASWPGGHLLPMAHMLDDVGWLVLLYRPVLFLPSAAVTVRRLHDIGRSGWWGLLWVLPVPILGWFVLVPWLMRPSDPGPNSYGTAPPAP